MTPWSIVLTLAAVTRFGCPVSNPLERAATGIEEARARGPSWWVTGGTPEERARVADALRSLPELQHAGCEPVEVRIDPRTEFGFYEGPTSEIPGGVVSLNQALVRGGAEYLVKTAADACGDPEDPDFRRGVEELGSVLVHELAHRRHFGACRSPDPAGKPVPDTERINQFSAVRWSALAKAYREDPRTQRIMAEMAALALRRGYPSLSEERYREEYCRLKRELAVVYRSYGLPQRHQSDVYAATGDDVTGTVGDEYFAMAIGMLFFYPERFCQGYSAEERRWLYDNLDWVRDPAAPPPASSCWPPAAIGAR